MKFRNVDRWVLGPSTWEMFGQEVSEGYYSRAATALEKDQPHACAHYVYMWIEKKEDEEGVVETYKAIYAAHVAAATAAWVLL